uniref:Uncharacterized protein n=1 Tax=Tetranychus urticae TaxID=32264 RepID=T1JVQ8_TETUR
MLAPLLTCLLIVSLGYCQEDDYFSDQRFNVSPFSEDRNPSNSQSYAYLAKWYPHLKRFIGRGGSQSSGYSDDEGLGINYMSNNDQYSDGPAMYNDDGPGEGDNGYRGGYRGGADGYGPMFGRYGSSDSGSRDWASSRYYPSHDVNSDYRPSHEPAKKPSYHSEPYHIQQPYSYSPRLGDKSEDSHEDYSGANDDSRHFSYGHSLAHGSNKKSPYVDYGYNKPTNYDYDEK